MKFTKSDIACVTGGGSGIGRATCQLLAQLGATVVVVDINKTSADQTLASLPSNDRDHMSILLDVTNKENVSAAIDDVIINYSTPPNITVNCAGFPLTQSLLEATEETLDKLFDVNVKGTIWVTQCVCQKLIAAKKNGSIVNIASMNTTGIALSSIYSSTKGAVESFSLSAAKEFEQYRIRVNAVCPGYVDTPLLDIIPKYRSQEYIQRNAMKRMAKPEEIAEVIAFLASDISSYVNGASMLVHGGGQCEYLQSPDMNSKVVLS